MVASIYPSQTLILNVKLSCHFFKTSPTVSSSLARNNLIFQKYITLSQPRAPFLELGKYLFKITAAALARIIWALLFQVIGLSHCNAMDHLGMATWSQFIQKSQSCWHRSWSLLQSGVALKTFAFVLLSNNCHDYQWNYHQMHQYPL